MNTQIPIPATYDGRLVLLSIVIAIFSSYVALDLAGRVTASRGYSRLAWLIGGATAMGTGIWSMHYTGMASVTFMPMDAAPNLSYAINISVLANCAVILITLIALASAVLTSLIDRRFGAQARALAHSEHRYQLLFESNPHPTFVFDQRTLFLLAVNKAAIDKYGFSAEEFLRKKITDLQADKPEGSRLTAPSAGPSEGRHRQKDGTAFDVELSLRLIVWTGKPAGLLLANDITERKRTEEMEAERRNFLETITQNQPLEASLHLLVHMLEKQLSGALCSILLVKPNKFCRVAASTLGKDMLAGVERFKLDEIALALGTSHNASMAFVENFPAACPNKELSEWAAALNLKSCWTVPVTDAGDVLIGLIVTFFHDVRQPLPQDRNRLQMAAGMASIAIEHRRLTDRLSYQAQHDALTGLPNRFLLEDRLQQAIAYANRHGSSLAVLLANLLADITYGILDPRVRYEA